MVSNAVVFLVGSEVVQSDTQTCAWTWWRNKPLLKWGKQARNV